MNAIEQLEQQLDDLGAKLRERDQRIKRLEGENRKLRIKSNSVAEGAMKGFQTALENMQNRYEAIIAELEVEKQEMEAVLIPSQLMDSAPRPGCARVGVIIMVVHPPDGEEMYPIEIRKLRGDYIGDVAEIPEYLVDAIGVIIAQIPTAEDFARRGSWRKYLSGLTMRDIGSIFLELTYLRNDLDMYKKRRLEIAKLLWDKLNKPEYPYTWTEFNDWFDKFTNETFANVDKVKRRITSETFRQNLS